jgi:hypothetical protein
MTIGSEVYHAIATYAEKGERVTKVVLPLKLYNEWIEEGHNINSLFAKLGVSIVSGEVTTPKFFTGEPK